MRRIIRSTTIAAAAIACALVAALAATAGASSHGKKTSGTFYIGLTPQVKSGLEYVAGQATDKALGPVAVTFTIKPLPGTSGSILAKATKVTLWSSTGTLSGSGSATLTITNTPNAGDATATNGVVSLTKGTGGLKGHSFKVKFSGSGSISTGEYTFKYSGTYK